MKKFCMMMSAPTKDSRSDVYFVIWNRTIRTATAGLHLNKIVPLFISVACCINAFAQTIIIQENFTAYQGTSATVPSGWTFTYNGNYTTITNSGPSGPNSYKFGVTAATITTPNFASADSVSFWIKGISTDAVSKVDVLYTVNNTTWNTIATINPIPTSGTIIKYAVPSAAVALQFVYTKSAGNVAFDDFLLTNTGSIPSSSASSGKILVYFNQPVDTNFSTGLNAIYLNQTMDDTLIAYINRAKNTIDIAQYEYSQSISYSNIAAAVNNAYNRGVKIRWIYDGAATNTGLAALNVSIPTLASPTGINYNIMHNKFVIVDGRWNTSSALDAWLCTSSLDWNGTQVNNDFNNMIFIQDSALTHAFTHEFNIMWGDTGMTPNSANSKFGQYKPNSGRHNFTIGGHLVELYFSPSDSTNNHILSSIASANTDMYFSMYAFTDNADATALVNKKNSGVYVAGIVDQFSNTSSAYTTLQSGLGSSNFKTYTGGFIYHNKYLIVDPSNTCSDPLVLTGSHNWTFTADTKNDENTIIIHDDTIANIYYQAFHKDFYTLGGTLTQLPPCVVGENEIKNSESGITFYPNPSSGNFTIMISDLRFENAEVEIYNVYGEKVYEKMYEGRWMMDNGNTSTISHQPSAINLDLPNGIYFLQLESKEGTISKKIIVAR